MQQQVPYRSSYFTRFAKWTAHAMGHPRSFAIALLVILTWAISGPMFHFSDTWQLVINTGTTIITFLMVFLIQNTQNRDSAAMQIKLDEIIRATEGGHNALLDLEELTDEELVEIHDCYIELAKKARQQIRNGKKDTHRVEVKKAASSRRK
jgi:low affinity Fe/Cu permease